MFGQPIQTFAIGKNFLINLTTRQVTDTRTGQVYNYDNVDTKILIYEDRQKTWFFDIADKLKKDNEAGFVILMIAVSYLEGNQQFRDGRSSQNNSTVTIHRALRRIFIRLNESQRDLFIKQVRHGFSHDGITRKSVLIDASMNRIFSEVSGNLFINPHRFLESIEKDFRKYMSAIKNRKNLNERANFEAFWDKYKGI